MIKRLSLLISICLYERVKIGTCYEYHLPRRCFPGASPLRDISLTLRR